MGDRSYIIISIGGHIRSVKQLDKIIEALETQGLSPDDDADDFKKHFALVAAGQAFNNQVSFHDYECDSATIDIAEAALQDENMPYHVSNEEGGNYGAACWSWSQEHGRNVTGRIHGEGPSITITDLKDALKSDDPLSKIIEIVTKGDLASGLSIPDLTFSKSVKSHLLALLETTPPQK